MQWRGLCSQLRGPALTPIRVDALTGKKAVDPPKNLWFLILKTNGFQKVKALKLKLKLYLKLKQILEQMGRASRPRVFVRRPLKT